VPQSDAVLVARSLAGDRRGFDALVARYKDTVHRITLRMTGSTWDAQDLAQESLVQAWVKLPQLAEPAKFGCWLRTVAANTCKMWLRRQRNGSVSLEDLGGDADGADAYLAEPQSVEQGYEAVEMRRSVRQAVRRLSDRNRAAVWMYYLEGQTCAEVASSLGVPVSTVAGRLHKSRKILGHDGRLRQLGAWSSHAAAAGREPSGFPVGGRHAE
jgi:RNA polymerase sigma-70 factor (ECF subfamily)